MIEGQARAEAKARMSEGGAIGAMITNGAGCGQLATPRKQPSISHKARDEIAEAVGMATTTRNAVYAPRTAERERLPLGATLARLKR